ncbi:NADP-dependent oxidoreductase domain-containing protein [Syncephalastrum racemosum]|uniref:NADP-dependent oxidoreductase domain-containing protein n=1 Tax=Syncephalastrum racemosum TaxID=13706 RepID=A0A1X2H2E1_SYNRA|nr:NADP-dependent oxidoreductase domain-containing protein [Syncephalastrum racemosum]
MVANIKLNNGQDMPVIGFGTFGGSDGPKEVYEASKVALELGYRHFDTAYVYETEEALGKALRESSVPRNELFITTKLFQTFHRPEHVKPAFERSLELLKLDYVDLYLMHWPFAWEFHGYEFKDLKGGIDEKGHYQTIDVPFIDTYRAMEQLVKDGRTRAIGVSNFTIPMLEELLSKCEIPPAVNQVELHPSLPQEDLVQYCKSKGIVLTAYSPLGNPGRRGQHSMIEHPVTLEAAKKYNKTPSQIFLNWGLSRGYTVIPKSKTPSRIAENFEQFEMEKADVEAITRAGLENPRRTVDPAVIYGPANDIFGTFA